MKTAGRWTWKSSSAKDCVITHLPNKGAPKMDGAKASVLHCAFGLNEGWIQKVTWRGVECFLFSRTKESAEGVDVNPAGADPGADLGGSSNDSHENCEGRGEKRFQGDIDWLWVSRPWSWGLNPFDKNVLFYLNEKGDTRNGKGLIFPYLGDWFSFVFILFLASEKEEKAATLLNKIPFHDASHKSRCGSLSYLTACIESAFIWFF